MAQTDHNYLIPAGVEADGRMEWAYALHRCVRSLLGVFNPAATMVHQSAEPCVLRDLQVVRLLVFSGILSPQQFFSAEQWASLVSLGCGDVNSSSTLSAGGIDYVSSVMILSDSSIMCHGKKQHRLLAVVDHAVWKRLGRRCMFGAFMAGHLQAWLPCSRLRSIATMLAQSAGGLAGIRARVASLHAPS